MQQIALCPECGVPEPFYLAQRWLDNGDIVQDQNPHARISFIECEPLDPLFNNISKIVGTSIDGIIVNLVARGSEVYLKRMIPAEVSQMVQDRTLNLEPFIDAITTFCQVIGYGQYDFLDYRFESDDDDFAHMRMLHPFSVPEAAGSFAGALSAVAGGEHAIDFEEISPGHFEMKSYRTKYDKVFSEKMRIPDYCHRDGDVEFERCKTCQTPSAFSEYYWYLEKGVIINAQSGRRMAVLGQELLDAVFDALKWELGDTIPEIIVEAQRRFAKTGFYSIEEVGNVEEFRIQLALRGLGNVRELTMGVNGLRMSIDNACGHLMTIGLAQGLFETALDVDSDVEWELSQDGNLVVEVSPRKRKVAGTRLPRLKLD